MSSPRLAGVSDAGPRPAPGMVTWVLGGLLLTVAGAGLVGPRAAGYMLTLTLAGVCLARATLPPSLVQPFVIRSRWIDITVMGTVALSLAVMTTIAPF